MSKPRMMAILVFSSQKEQNGILWLDGHSGEFEIFLDEQQRITIMDLHGTKLHPEGATVLKFNDKDIYPEEIEGPNKSQTLAEQIEFSDFATSESDLLDDQILISYGVESTIVNEEVPPAHYDSSSTTAKNIHHERLIENDAVSFLQEGGTDNAN